jgi:hypothetical protein
MKFLFLALWPGAATLFRAAGFAVEATERLSHSLAPSQLLARKVHTLTDQGMGHRGHRAPTQRLREYTRCADFFPAAGVQA